MGTLQISAQTSKASQSASDRRRRARLPGRAPGWLMMEREQSADPWEVIIRDVSRNGVGFSSGMPLSVGDTCRIRIGMGPMKLAKRMRVVNCVTCEGHTFAIGGEFY